MTDIIKKPDGSSSLTLNKDKLSSKSTPFQQRVNEAKAQQADASTMPNRIALMLDCSSSMSSYADNIGRASQPTKRCIDLLKEAIENFAMRCNFTDTSLAFETFPPGTELPLTSNELIVRMTAQALEPRGSTPMHACVERCIEKIPMTRAVLVSDGEATDWHDFDCDDVFQEAKGKGTVLDRYKEMQIPIDCVHIGASQDGEALLRHIAQATGGLYIKFTDVSAFSTAFGFLAPSCRAMLTNGRIDASQLGAKELLR